MSITRAQREKHASDETHVYRYWHRLRERFSHIFESPNSQRAYHFLNDLLKQEVSGRRILEIGCGGGAFAERLSSFGATYVYAIDISEIRIEQAKAREVPGKLEYAIADASQALPGRFDVIVGQAVLHHLDYQKVLQQLVGDNLQRPGLLIFLEPLGENWFMRLFRRFSRKAHTPDEHPFDRHDLAWLRRTFPGFLLMPFNFVSLPLGALSSLLFKRPDTHLMQIADGIDWYLARHVFWLHAYFRFAIFVIHLPESAPVDSS
jgi:SAM-dependent methyltransferase